MTSERDARIKTLQLHVAKVGQAYHMDAQLIDLVDDLSFFDGLVLRVIGKVVEWRPDTEKLRVPATWWDHWKQAHIDHPLFFAFVDAHPVRYRTYEARMFLPDFPVPVHDGVHVIQVPYFTEYWGYPADDE